MADQIQVASLTGAPTKSGRLAYIDWLRGLACVLMFQTHCYNSWLSADARNSPLYAWSQLLGTLPAPLFILLAGVSSAMVTQRLREKGLARNAVARTTILRGAEIFGLGLLFRGQEFVLGYPNSPWTDLLRVDVLNILGLSMMLMGVLCWLTASPTVGNSTVQKSNERTIGWSLLVAAAVVITTPWLWTTYRPRWLPWPLESYVNGVHIYAQPQPWLFPMFPWVAFAFVGLTLGFLLSSNFAKTKESWFFAAVGGVGLVACILSLLFDRAPVRLYSTTIYDYWHTSPNFFLMRCGVLLALVFLVYAWCRWGWARRGFSPIIQLGNTSLLVYWVHIEFVYGRFSILPKGRCSIVKATGGLLIIFVAMVALSLLRTKWKKQRARVLRASPAPAAATAESG